MDPDPGEPPAQGAVEIVTGTPAELFRFLFDALNDFNRPYAGPADFTPLAACVRDPGGRLQAGLWGRTGYRWLAIQMLYVAEPCRGRGLGAALLAAAEQAALARGCIGAQVDTFSFQARGFYERRGFGVMGVQEDLPQGHRCYYLVKRID